MSSSDSRGSNPSLFAYVVAGSLATIVFVVAFWTLLTLLNPPKEPPQAVNPPAKTQQQLAKEAWRRSWFGIHTRHIGNEPADGSIRVDELVKGLASDQVYRQKQRKMSPEAFLNEELEAMEGIIEGVENAHRINVASGREKPQTEYILKVLRAYRDLLAQRASSNGVN
jgi:hypothetical protein